MGKRRAKIFALVAAMCLALTLGLTACAGGSKETSTITLDKTTLAIERFDVATITATVEGTTDEVVWSSDNEAVATVDGGVVTAVSAGVATITAKVGDVSATCAVTVTDSGYFPVLNTGKTELALTESATFTLNPSVTFRGNDVTASFTYEVEDATVATVSEAGVITAVKEGTTTVTVKSSYVGYQLEETVTVKVMENSSITLSDSSVVLATSTPDGTDYLTTKTVTADIMDKGADGDASKITWTTGSDDVATVEGGVITAVGEGTTTVTATYVTTGGKTITATVAVEVIIPVVAYDGSFDWDLSTGKVQIDVKTVADKAAADVVRVEYDGAAITTSAVDTDKIKLDGVTFGEKTVTVYFADIAYDVNVVVANKIVTTKDELTSLKSYLDQGVNGVWDGYFIIAADIDMQGGRFTPFQNWTDGLANGAYGFKGVIDGRGHVISNVTVDGDNRSLIGYALMEGGVVKNIGFVDVEASGRNAAIVAFRSYGLIENVFVKATGTNRSNLSGLVSAVAHGTYKNIFVYVDETGSTGDNVGSVIGTTNAKATLTNVFAVAKLQIIGSDPNASTLTNCGKSLNLAAFKEAEYDLGGFDTEYWTVDGKLPLFKSYANMLSDFAITTSVTELFAKDEVTFEANHEATFSAQTDIDGVTVLPDGTVTVSEDFEGEATLVLVATSQFDQTKTDTLQIAVKSVRRQDLTDTYRIDLGSSDISVTLTGVTGTVNKVLNANGGEVAATIEGNKITFTKDALVAVGFGKQKLSFVTDDIIYDAANVYIVSKVVTTKADLENLKSYATQVSTGVWDGYFVIDNDIDMAGGHFSNIQGWRDGTNGTYGFKGTIDGQGHIIANVAVGGETQNLVGYLMADGVVKNIGFVNAVLTGKSPALVAFRSYGTIENIFAVAERSVASNNAYSGVIVNLSHADIKNCTVYVNDTDISSGVVGSHVGNAETAFAFVNSWAVSTLNYTNQGAKIGGGGQKFTRTNSIGQRKSIAVLKEYIATAKNKQDLSVLDTSIWDISLGVPVFKSYMSYIDAIAAVDAPATVNSNETVTIKANGRAVFEIAGETTAATITAQGVLTANEVSADTVVTVRVKSDFNNAKYSDIQITVKKALEKVQLAGTYTADLTTALVVPTTGIEGDVTGAKVGTTALTYTVGEGEIQFSAAEVAKIGYGEKTISVLTADKEYVVSVDIYSKIITTKDEFLNMKSYLTAATEFPGTRYDGRIALGANIDLEGEKFTTMEAHASSGGSWNTYGFRGTFDGKGYTVSNLGGFNGISATYGIFGIVGADAVIKNVAFVNATIDGSACGLFSMRMHGTIENVYVQGTRTTGGNWSGALVGLNHGTISNCVVNVDDSGSTATNNGALFGNAEADCTITNCFAISSKTALVGNENGKTVTITNCGIAASAEAFGELTGVDLTVLSSEYWDTTSGFPVFKTKA